MAARNPTSFTQWVDDAKFESGKDIAAAEYVNVLDDQVFCLDKQRMISTTGTFGFGLTSQDAAPTTKVVFYVMCKDMCDVDSVTNDEIECDVYALVRSEAATAGTVSFTSGLAAANATATVTVPVATLFDTWIAGGDTMNIKTNGNEDDITVQMERTAGTGTVYVWAWLIVAKEA